MLKGTLCALCGFNVASVRRPRKSAKIDESIAALKSFNVASVRRPRKFGGKQFESARFLKLQCGLGPKTEEIHNDTAGRPACT